MKKRGLGAQRGRRIASPSSSSKRTPPDATATAPPSARYLFFGGKGGVGKTTVAASTALHLLYEARPRERILLFSTDPAHSLSDSLKIHVGDRLTEVARKGSARLIAYEMDARAALEKFKTEHRAILSEIADRGTLLDESDINELLNLSLPGLDEVMALFELSELLQEGANWRIVVDTAPSGHTSRLLRLPETFAHMIRALDLMAEKHRYMIAQFVRGGRVRADEVDLFLSDLAERIERVRAMLYDSERTSFTLVCIPEAMSVAETERYQQLLREEGVPVTDLVINRVEEEHDACPYCRSRVASQAPWLKEISHKFKNLRQHHVPLLPEEVRGLDSLRSFAKLVWKRDVARDAGTRGEETRRRGDAETRGKKSLSPRPASPRPRVSFILSRAVC